MGGIGNIAKIVAGLALMAGGIAWYFARVPGLSDALAVGELVPFWRSFLVIFAGFFGLILLLAGLLVAWIGYDNYKSAD